jgi:4-methyl-5(b-hydroxyethyl)-thiazole monophosphate biosynthesis
MVTILTILPEGFEEIEAVTPIDLWRRAGFEVTVASLEALKLVSGRSEIVIQVDISLAEIDANTLYDMIFLPGGPGVKHLRSSSELRGIIKRHDSAGKSIAAICAAPLALKDAGLLVGRKYTAHPSTASELAEILSDQPVVVDKNIITSRGAGTSVVFALRIIEILAGVDLARKVGLSICAEVVS